MGIANAYAGLEMGVDMFDSCVAGLGGCPFAGHKGAAGNVCTEDLVFMCQEMGIETGIDLDKLIECARLAEEIVGHPLPGSVKLGGNLGVQAKSNALVFEEEHHGGFSDQARSASFVADMCPAGRPRPRP